MRHDTLILQYRYQIQINGICSMADIALYMGIRHSVNSPPDPY